MNASERIKKLDAEVDRLNESWYRDQNNDDLNEDRKCAYARAEGYKLALADQSNETTFGRLNALEAWAQLYKQNLKLIREEGGKVRRRGGNGAEYFITDLSNIGDVGRATLSRTDRPSLKTSMLQDELIAEFEMVD